MPLWTHAGLRESRLAGGKPAAADVAAEPGVTVAITVRGISVGRPQSTTAGIRRRRTSPASTPWSELPGAPAHAPQTCRSPHQALLSSAVSLPGMRAPPPRTWGLLPAAAAMFTERRSASTRLPATVTACTARLRTLLAGQRSSI